MVYKKAFESSLPSSLPDTLGTGTLNMKLTTFLATSILFLVPTVAGAVLVPEVVPVARDNGLLPRVTTSFTFCTGTDFGGQCNTYALETDVCYVGRFLSCRKQTISSN